MMFGRRFGTAATALVLVAGMGLVACGDDDDGGGDAIGLGGDGDSADGGGSDTTIDVGDIAGLSEECEIFAEAVIAFSSAFTGQAESDFDELADAMAEFAAAAPDEIQDDVEVLADAYAEFAAGLGDIDLSDPESFSDPEVAARISAAAEVFNEPRVNEANEALNAFTEENCSTPG